MQHETVLVEDSSVQVKLIAFTQNNPPGTTVPIRDFTNFEWDEVCRLGINYPYNLMKKKAGDELAKEYSRLGGHGSILAFFHQGKPVHAFAFIPPVSLGFGKKFCYSKMEAIVEAYRPNVLGFKE